MTSERGESPAAPERPAGGPGKALAAQREAMGWTVEQVADQLKLAVRQVVAIEADDFAALPSPAVTRGFVRAYAKILKLDAAPLVAQIPVDSVPAVDVSAVRREARPATFSESRFPSHGRRSGLPLGWIAAVLVLAAAAGAAWKFGLLPVGQQHAEPAAAGETTVLPSPVTGTAAGNGAAPETLQSTSVPLISVPAPAGTPGTERAAPAAAGDAATPAAGAAPAEPGAAAAPVAAVTAPAANAATPTAPAPAATAPAAGGNALVFTVAEDSWIDVRPAKGGKPLVSRLVKAGSTETLNVTEPVKVVVGNTHGVTATLRGNAVELPGKTARINLQ